MTSVYLIRHGQSQGNIEQRFQGRVDRPLTELGMRQAKQTAHRMRCIPISAIYTSPLMRAMETADEVAKPHGIIPIIRPNLVEIDGGAFEDRTFEELRETYPEEITIFFEQPHLFVGVDGGESIHQVYDRISKEIVKLASDHPNQNIVIVSHGAALHSFFCYASGYTPDKLPDTPWSQNAGVSHIIFDEALKPSVQYIGDISHLSQ